ncbi:MAG: type II methionyl aminopeptidase [Candidatus Altiarchaeales archaeon]|nr:type II methionyl aminopeptidase [Candidatus Altiarchaeales archaeon]
MEESELEKYRAAGKIACEVREWSRSLVKPNARMLDVAESIESKILEKKAGLAFPATVCVNDVTAHYTPKYNDEAVLRNGDVVSIDLGVHIDGFIADTAYTMDLGGRHARMLEVNEQALGKIVGMIKPGVSVKELGSTLYNMVTKAGFKPIENLTGHEVKQYDLHAGISIPNIPVPYDWKLKEDMVLAIEPFITDGYGRVVESKHASIYSLLDKKPVRMPEARMLLKEVEDRGKLPFTDRWYAKKISPVKLPLAVQELQARKVIRTYPTLHEKEKGVVSHFEHTVIVTKDGNELIT